ncbi:PE-PPE domain-containing protein [Mycobacterium syngnathidarum]
MAEEKHMKVEVGSTARAMLIAGLAVFGAFLIGVTSTVQSAYVLAATRALIVPGTGTPDPAVVTGYQDHAVDYYLAPGGDCAEECTAVPVPYIAQFWPIPLEGWGGLSGAKWDVSVQSGVDSLNATYSDQREQHPDGDVAIFGYSQGATVVSQMKSSLQNPANADQLNFFLIANPQRPNGGLASRLGVLGTVPLLDLTLGRPTPTDTCEHSDGSHCATDFALMYDGIADFPTYPINVLADVNALAGFWYAHGTYLSPKGDDALTETPYGYTPDEVKGAVAEATANCDASTHCQRHGDTIYLTLPARTLPIMQPLLDFGDSTGTSSVVVPIVDLVSPMMQTLIETGYDRTDYGAPTPAKLLPHIDVAKLATDLFNDIPEGINAALEPGLNPLPGSVDESSSPTTVTASPSDRSPVADAVVGVSSVSDEESVVTERAAEVSEAPKVASQVSGAKSPASERTALKRLSAIAKPGKGLMAAESKSDRSVLRRPIGSDAESAARLPQQIRNRVNKFENVRKELSNLPKRHSSAGDGAAKPERSDAD